MKTRILSAVSTVIKIVIMQVPISKLGKTLMPQIARKSLDNLG